MQCLETFLIIIGLFTLSISSTSQSEILIIRHGRSRSRHSVEKDHVRWGLKALDNLTIVENHEDFLESGENETNGELNVVSLYENNGTLSQSSEFNSTLGSFEINFTHGPSRSGTDDKGGNKKHHHEWHHRQIPPTTEIPKSASTSLSPSISISNKRRNGRKKEIMSNIKNTVNKGIQYLRSHESLDEIKIEIKEDIHAKRTAKSNKIRSESMVDHEKSLLSLPSTLHKLQQHKTRLQKQIKINGGKALGIVTILSSEPNARNKNSIPKTKKSNEKQTLERHAAAHKHIKNHPFRNQLDLSLNSNLADVFYVPTSTEENPLNVEEQMQGDEPAGKGEKEDDAIQKSLMEISNRKDTKLNKSSGKVENLSTVASIANQSLAKSIKTSSQDFEDKASRDVLNEKEAIRFNSHSDTQHDLPSSRRENDKNRIEWLKSNQANDETNDDETNEEFINTINIQNDETSNENNLDFDGEIAEENPNLTGIYHVADVDLDQYDETSRINRKNLMRGRDVVTRFLQIVESQHVLGGNCTAGTDLNLGEGVVDRYAQDRFRVEAEVAVNRANMLTR